MQLFKDNTEFPHKQDLVYHTDCPVENCNDDYVGETARRISEKVIDHRGRDKKLSYFKTPNRKKKQLYTQYINFKIISSGFRNDTMKRKL